LVNMQKFKKEKCYEDRVYYTECDWCSRPIDDDIYRNEVTDPKFLKLAGAKIPPERRFGDHIQVEFPCSGCRYEFDICEECFNKYFKDKCRQKISIQYMY